jgi:hypothetical protein
MFHNILFHYKQFGEKYVKPQNNTGSLSAHVSSAADEHGGGTARVVGE